MYYFIERIFTLYVSETTQWQLLDIKWLLNLNVN